jgi:hypothetical protein
MMYQEQPQLQHHWLVDFPICLLNAVMQAYSKKIKFGSLFSKLLLTLGRGRGDHVVEQRIHRIHHIEEV